MKVGGSDNHLAFKEDYKRFLSLEAIKANTHKHKHLPEVPSVEEMETDGVDVGEIDILLKRTRELTLNVIAKDLEIQKINSINSDLIQRLINVSKL